MKIAAVIPTRGDKKLFCDFAKYQMERQTLHIDIVNVINGMPVSDAVDIVQRYKRGVDQCLELGADLIFFIEDDDFYAPEYIERMVTAWAMAGQPDLFGYNRTLYYHIFYKQGLWINHKNRASMFNTMITKDLNINWPDESERLVDVKLWRGVYDKYAEDVIDPICIGIKHGIGKVGGKAHKKDFYAHKNAFFDADMTFFKNIVKDDFSFYEKIIHERN